MHDPQASAATQYIASPFISWPLHAAERLVLLQDNPQPLRLHETLSNVLLLCDQWRSLEGHAAKAIEMMPDLQPHARQLMQGLAHMVKQGLLVDAARLSNSYATHAATGDEPGGDIETLYVRTYRCPQALERLLQSLQTGRAGASVRTLVVVDDARDEADLALSQDLLTSWCPRLSAKVIHVTRSDRERLAVALAAASGADAKDLCWWLNGDPDDPEMSAGATFNTALLLSAGSVTAIVDDDAQLTPYGDSLEVSEMGLAGKEEVRWTMYQDREALQSAWSPLDIDPLQDHSRWLGHSLPALVAQASSPEAFWQSFTSGDLLWLQSHAQVKVSVNGTLGDPGTGQASWLYTQPSEQLLPWLESESSYRQLISGRHLARKPQGHKLLPHHILLSPLVGVDNRQLMPPTLPNGRAEDALFADLVSVVYPQSLFAQLPWMLMHAPETARQFDSDALLRPMPPHSVTLLAGYVQKLRHVVPSAEPHTRLQWLGQSLQAFAEAPQATLVTECSRQLTNSRSNMARELIKNLQALQPPPYLADDMQLLLARSCQGIETDQKDMEQAIASARQRARRYSGALASWHSAWVHCCQLGEDRVLAMAQS